MFFVFVRESNFRVSRISNLSTEEVPQIQKDTEPYEVNALNQITSHLEYDLNGNPIRQDDTLYTYDALDRLIKIETPTLTQTFQYDSLHRCLSKTTNQQTQYFLYDGQKEIGSFDENLSIQELRILGHTPHAEIGAAIAVELQGKAFAPIHDLQGNIATLIPLDATPPTQYRYSAFGEEQIDGPALSPWRFSSKRSDASTNLVYYGRRFYMPLLGRWLTPDPAGFTDGMNLYAFVHNDPLTHFDEYGLLDYSQWKNQSWNEIAARSYQMTKTSISNTWNNPRFQGSMQAFGGLMEAGIGGTMALGTGGIAAPAGWFVMAHGFDQFVTGMNRAFSGRYRYSTTNQLLQKTGMSPQTADLVDGGLSLAGGMGGTAAARISQIVGFQKFRLPAMPLRKGLQRNDLITLYRAVKTEELKDIQKTGIFRNLGSAEGKYFTTSVEGASSYAKQAVIGFGDSPYTLTSTRTSKSILDGLSSATVDRGIPAWVVPEERLEGLVPEILNWMPIPKQGG